MINTERRAESSRSSTGPIRSKPRTKASGLSPRNCRSGARRKDQRRPRSILSCGTAIATSAMRGGSSISLRPTRYPSGGILLSIRLSFSNTAPRLRRLRSRPMWPRPVANAYCLRARSLEGRYHVLNVRSVPERPSVVPACTGQALDNTKSVLKNM